MNFQMIFFFSGENCLGPAQALVHSGFHEAEFLGPFLQNSDDSYLQNGQKARHFAHHFPINKILKAGIETI